MDDAFARKDRVAGAPVTVLARLLAEPSLWCWEIRDVEANLVESSWSSYWAAYPSKALALSEGTRRARDLTRNDRRRARSRGSAAGSVPPRAESA